MAYLVLFFIGLALMFAGAFKLAREAYLNKRRADFWFDRWKAEVEDNVNLYMDLKKLRQEHEDLALQYDATVQHYQEDLQGLETGTMEIEENYQQELLTEYDKVADLCKLVGSLEEIRLDHNVHCLPRLGEDFYPNDEDDEAPVYEELAITWKW